MLYQVKSNRSGGKVTIPAPAIVFLVVSGFVASAVVVAMSEQGAHAPVVVEVPIEPVPVRGTDGQFHLAYELHLTNFDLDTGILRLDRVDAFGDRSAAPLLSYSAADLDARVIHPGAESRMRFNRSIEGGKHGVVHIWITFEKNATLPATLRHHLVFRTEKDTEATIDGVQVRVRKAVPILIGPPLKQGAWLVHNGPGNHRSPHWGSLLALNGRVTVPQRFAVDFIGLDANGTAVRGDVQTSANEDWIGFGADVIAVADGIVRDTHDGTMDNRPLAVVPAPASLTPAGLYGNYAILEVGPETFVHYGHLQPGSVSVRTGQRVRRGQFLGRVGNSGNTNGAHLHFHVSDSAAFENSEGLPFLIDSFEVLGETTADRALGAAPGAPPAALSPRSHRQELPLHGTVVRFR